MFAVSLRKLLNWLLLVPCLVSLILIFTFVRANPDPNFWFVPALPVPTYAMHIVHSDNPLYDNPLGGYRIITFETDQPADKIQQFYRTELPKRGWYFLCSPTQLEQPGCPLGLSPEVELADAYQRYDEPSKMRAIDVSVYKPGENLISNNRELVEIIEYRYPLSPH
jgi:hypothetical protein